MRLLATETRHAGGRATEYLATRPEQYLFVFHWHTRASPSLLGGTALPLASSRARAAAVAPAVRGRRGEGGALCTTQGRRHTLPPQSCATNRRDALLQNERNWSFKMCLWGVLLPLHVETCTRPALGSFAREKGAKRAKKGGPPGRLLLHILEHPCVI